MRFQADHAIGYVDARFFHSARPANIRRLIEARLQFHRHRHLLAVLGRIDQFVDDLAFTGSTVQRHLDGANLGICTGGIDETLHRVGEGFIGMLQQYRAGVPNDMKDTARIQQFTMLRRMMVGVVQFRQRQHCNFHQIPGRQHTGGLVYIVVAVQAQFRRQHTAAHRIHTRLHNYAHDGSELPVPDLGLDHRQQIVGSAFIFSCVGVSRNVEMFTRQNLHIGKQQIQVVRHHIFERNKVISGTNP